jgi:hypothetical protein
MFFREVFFGNLNESGREFEVKKVDISALLPQVRDSFSGAGPHIEYIHPRL